MARKKLIMMAGAAVVLLGGAAGALVGLGILPHRAVVAGAKPVAPKPILFAELSNVVVSVPEDAGDPPSSFVQFDVQFSTTDPNALNDFSALQPIIKSDIISLLMGETGKALEDPGTRAALAQGCLDISNKVLVKSGSYAPEQPFNAAYITNLVVQD
jgi:flagellar basal body-associated protein FliL